MVTGGAGRLRGASGTLFMPATFASGHRRCSGTLCEHHDVRIGGLTWSYASR
jgi:hypothetical protein